MAELWSPSQKSHGGLVFTFLFVGQCCCRGSYLDDDALLYDWLDQLGACATYLLYLRLDLGLGHDIGNSTHHCTKILVACLLHRVDSVRRKQLRGSSCYNTPGLAERVRSVIEKI